MFLFKIPTLLPRCVTLYAETITFSYRIVSFRIDKRRFVIVEMLENKH